MPIELVREQMEDLIIAISLWALSCVLSISAHWLASSRCLYEHTQCMRAIVNCMRALVNPIYVFYPRLLAQIQTEYCSNRAHFCLMITHEHTIVLHTMPNVSLQCVLCGPLHLRLQYLGSGFLKLGFVKKKSRNAT